MAQNNVEQKQQDPNNPVVQFKVEEQDVILSPSIIKEFLTNGQPITLPEFKMFTSLCKAKNLNPFLKEAYIVKYGDNPAQILTSKDVFLKRANNNPNYDGKENGIITLNKETKEITNRDGSFCPPNEETIGGWCKVYRKDRKFAEYVSVSVEECAKKKSDGKLNINWTNQKSTMIEKVAISRALRSAFPDEFSGMYIEEEMQQDNNNEQLESKVISDPLSSTTTEQLKEEIGSGIVTNKTFITDESGKDIVEVESVHVVGESKEVNINAL